MMLRNGAIALAVIALAAFAAFIFVVRQMSFVSVGMAFNRETRAALQGAMEDQKRLARLDPERQRDYRARFDELGILVRRLDVVQMTGAGLTRNVELVLTSLVLLMIASGALTYALLRRDRENRLKRVRAGLAELSYGSTNVRIADRRGDAIGTIARMIEEASELVAVDRKRIQYLEHLSAWQEAARRHAHEMRTPLTAARMEVERVVAHVSESWPEAASYMTAARTSIFDELERLRTFTKRYTSFAQIGEPQRSPCSLGSFVAEFCDSFRAAWPNLDLVPPGGDDDPVVMMDGGMIRQVLVNLCSNSAIAAGHERAVVRFSLSQKPGIVALLVDDSGPGIDPAIRHRLFQPYVTTRPIGEGMGLGLAISRKIMLDHGGDLDLMESEVGARFRLSFPEVS